MIDASDDAHCKDKSRNVCEYVSRCLGIWVWRHGGKSKVRYVLEQGGAKTYEMCDISVYLPYGEVGFRVTEARSL